MKLKTFKVQFKSSFSEMYNNSSHLREIILFVVFFRCVCDELVGKKKKEGRFSYYISDLFTSLALPAIGCCPFSLPERNIPTICHVPRRSSGTRKRSVNLGVRTCWPFLY